MIRVLIADDHPLVREGLSSLLDGSDDIDVVSTASNGADAVAAARETTPDVILMDLEMPGTDGIHAIREARAAGLDARVVVLTTFSDRDRILAALDAGAIGYLLKDAPPDEIVRGVHAAARGESPLAPRAAQALIAERTAARPAAELTVREEEVLRLVAEGMANKRIARELQISEATVKAHLTRVFQRIGVSDRTQAALWAQRHLAG